jgi:hypothetical protein
LKSFNRLSLRLISTGTLALATSALWIRACGSFSDGAIFAAGLLVAVYFPGRLVVSFLCPGSDPAERLLLSLLAGMVISSVSYFMLGLVEKRDWLWPAILSQSLAGACFMIRDIWRRPNPKIPGGSPDGWLWLGMALLYFLFLSLLVFVGYFDAYSEADGKIRISAFPDDGLFHAGIVHELLRRVPPSSPMISGYGLNYSYFMDILAALFHDLFGFDVIRLLYVLSPLFFFGLLFLAICTTGHSISPSPFVGLLCAFLVMFCGGMFNPILGMLFQGWEGGRWELIFHASTIVPLFFINPMVPALALFYGSLLCIHRAFQSPSLGWSIMAGILTAALVQYKIFGTAVIIAGLLGSLVICLKRMGGLRNLTPSLLVTLLALPFLLYYTFFKTGETNVVVSFQPGSPIFLTLEFLGLADFFRGIKELLGETWRVFPVALAALILGPLHVLGGLGIRAFALPSILREIIPGKTMEPFRVFLACAFLAGTLGTYLLSVAPRDLPGAYNNSVWFHAFSLHLAAISVSGLIHSFISKGGKTKRIVFVAIPILLSLLSTVQFLHWSKTNSKTYDAGPDVVNALEFLRDETSAQSLILLDPTNGEKDSLLVTGLAGRKIVISGSYLVAYQAPSREIARRKEIIKRFFRNPCLEGEAIDLYRPDYIWVRTDPNGPRWSDAVTCGEISFRCVLGGKDVALYKVIYSSHAL